MPERDRRQAPHNLLCNLLAELCGDLYCLLHAEHDAKERGKQVDGGR